MTAVVLALPLVGRLAVLRHGVIVTTLDPGLERALVAGGLALAAGSHRVGRARLVADAERPPERAEASATTGMITSIASAAPRLSLIA